MLSVFLLQGIPRETRSAEEKEGKEKSRGEGKEVNLFLLITITRGRRRKKKKGAEGNCRCKPGERKGKREGEEEGGDPLFLSSCRYGPFYKRGNRDSRSGERGRKRGKEGGGGCSLSDTPRFIEDDRGGTTKKGQNWLG